METARLTLRLPKEDVELAKRYAQEHRMTLTELIGRYFRHLRAVQGLPIHPEVEKISGLIPADIDVKSLYHERAILPRQEP